jgi:transposase
MKLLDDRIGQIAQDLAGDLQARAPEISVNPALDQHPERTTGKTEMRLFSPRPLSLSKIAAALKAGGRQRYIDERAREIEALLRSHHLSAPPTVTAAYGGATRATVTIVVELTNQISAVETELAEHFRTHPDADIYLSLPGIGVILGARVLGEFGDDPNRFTDAKCRKNYAATSPLSVASGRKHTVMARHVRNRRLYDAVDRWAFASLKCSPGAHTYYQQHRAAGDTHHQALRALGNRLVGILHGCLRHHSSYNEDAAGVSETVQPRASSCRM